MSKENRVSDERTALEAIERIIRENIVENDGPNRMKIGEDWHTGPVVDTTFRMLRGLQEIAANGLRSKPVAGVEVKPLVDFLWQEFCELPDRSSPEEYPDMALVSLRELTAIVEAFAERQALSLPAQEPVAWQSVDIEGTVHMTRSKAVADGWDRSEVFVRPLYASPQPEAAITEEMRAEALRLLKARDERDDKVQEIIEDLREIVLLMPAASRPDGLFKHAQDAVYAMRGRTRLMDDAALTATLKEATNA